MNANQLLNTNQSSTAAGAFGGSRSGVAGALTKLIDVRFGGRQIRVRYDGVNLDGWRIGAPRLDIVAGGLR